MKSTKEKYLISRVSHPKGTKYRLRFLRQHTAILGTCKLFETLEKATTARDEYLKKYTELTADDIKRRDSVIINQKSIGG